MYVALGDIQDGQTYSLFFYRTYQDPCIEPRMYGNNQTSAKEDPEEEKKGQTESNQDRREQRRWHAEGGEEGEAKDTRKEEQEEKN
ncbi:hypothetical protein NDU88_006418 [Pleurodeles waltl]|uniref:Uncharacterized protein n=1 Tax=Pleurodeles waltl TaxID=8319 RepID=A0AAV7MEX7_PLEWA|nr:hypothetical protein NDU88_006418 [Pleurodeles waltl]